MWNRIVFAVLAICLNITAYAQVNVSIQQGPELQPEKNAVFNRFLGVDKEAFYLMRIKTRGKGTSYFIEKYNKKTYTLIYSSDLELNEVKGALTNPYYFAVNAYCFNSKVYIYFEATDPDTKDKILYLKTIDKAGTVSAEVLISKGKADESPNFVQTVSQDSTLLAIVTEKSKLSPKAMPDVSVSIYKTSDFKLLKKVTMPSEYAKGRAIVGNYTLDNEGNLLFSFNFLDKNDEIGLALGIIPNNSSTFKAIEIELPKGKEIENGLVKFNDFDNTVMLMGMFKEKFVIPGKKKDKEEFKMGIFSYKIAVNTFTVKEKAVQYFTDDVNKKLTYAEGYVSESPGEKRYAPQEIIESGNANYFVASHSYRLVSDGNTVGGYMVDREIIVTKVNKDGKIEWMKLLPKNTSGNSRPFNVVAKKNKLYFFYLEHPKTTATTPDPDVYEYKKLYACSGITGPNVICVTLSDNGKMEKKVVFENKSWCMLPSEYGYMTEDKNALLIRFIKGDKEKFGVARVD